MKSQQKKEWMQSLLNLLNNSKFKAIYLLILFGLALFYLIAKGEEFYNLISIARIDMLVWAFVLFCIYYIINIVYQYLIYKSMTVPISYRQAFRIMSFTQLGKYVPGKIGVIGNYYIFSKEAGINTHDISQSFVLIVGLSVLCNSLCGLLLIGTLPYYLRYLVCLIPIGIGIFLHPKILNRTLLLFLQTIQRFFLKREEISVPELKEISYLSYLKITGLSFFNCLWGGLVLYFILLAFMPVEITGLYVCIAAGGLSMVLGMLAVFAPAGIGVREISGVAILGQISNAEHAIMAMICLRIMGTIIELIYGGIAFLALKNFALPEEIQE